MRSSIVGAGYVGVVAGACLASLGHEVTLIDVSSEKIAALNAGQAPFIEPGLQDLLSTVVHTGLLRASLDLDTAVEASDATFICVGTQAGEGGVVALAAVERACRSVGKALRHRGQPHSVVMRSTVPPGTAERLAIPTLEQQSRKQNGVGFCYDSNPEFLREGSSIHDFFHPPFTLFGGEEG